MTYKLEFRKIVKKFVNSRGVEIRALDGIELGVWPGEILVILGPSGCGKTTLLRMAAGFEFPSEGEILLNGDQIRRPGAERYMVAQQATILPWRTVQRNIEFGLEIAGVLKPKRQKLAEYYLNLVGLTGFEESYPFELSGGMKQRAALASALINKPEILLLDEPFGALDTQTRKQMQDELLHLLGESGQTTIFVTHSIEEALYLADRIAILTPRPGKLKKVLEMKLSRPRNRTHPEFNNLRKLINEFIEYEVKVS